MTRMDAAKMLPMTTIAAPIQNSTQVGPVCASRPCAPTSPTTAPDAGCSVTLGSSPSSTLLLFSGRCETEHQPAPRGPMLALRVRERLGLVPHLAYDDMLGR